jgi:calcineurin-like phosphoesterase family protein
MNIELTKEEINLITTALSEVKDLLAGLQGSEDQRIRKGYQDLYKKFSTLREESERIRVRLQPL